MNTIFSTTPLRILGHISCPQAFRKAASLIPDSDPVCMMIPPVTPDLTDCVRQFLDRIRDRSDVELSLNDWGTLYHCSQRKEQGQLKASLTAGCLLSGQDTDPLLRSFYQPPVDYGKSNGGRSSLNPPPSGFEYSSANVVEWEPSDHEYSSTNAIEWVPPSDALTQHWRTPSVFAAVPLLKQLGVVRLELFNQPLPLPQQGPGLKVTLIAQTVVSVSPCHGRCEACLSDTLLRGTIPVRRERNLYLASLPVSRESWIDRVITIS